MAKSIINSPLSIINYEVKAGCSFGQSAFGYIKQPLRYRGSLFRSLGYSRATLRIFENTEAAATSRYGCEFTLVYFMPFAGFRANTDVKLGVFFFGFHGGFRIKPF